MTYEVSIQMKLLKMRLKKSDTPYLKIFVDDSKPVTKDMLQDLKRIVGEHTYSSSEVIGVIETNSPLSKWQSKFKAAHSFGGRPLRIVIDPANMIGGLEIETFRAFEP